MCSHRLSREQSDISINNFTTNSCSPEYSKCKIAGQSCAGYELKILKKTVRRIPASSQPSQNCRR